MFFEPSENHWHGATPDRFMTHVSIVLNDDHGDNTTWVEHVSDEQYGQAPDATQ